MPIRAVIAEVNGEPIYLDEFSEELKHIQINSEEGLPVTDTKRVQARVLLDNLVDQMLILQEAKNKQMVVGIDEIEAAYSRVKNGWRPVGFEDALFESSLSVAVLKAELRKLLMIQRYFRDIVYARLVIRDDEISVYLESHPELLIRPQRVRALQIVVKTKEEASNIAREIRRGMKFEEAAMKYSLGPEGKNGGDLGFFSAGEMPAVFDEVCFNLRLGQLSPVVATDYGYHLFKIVDRQGASERSLAEVREEVELKLRREQEEAAQKRVIARLRDNAKLKLPTEKEIEIAL